LIADHGEGNEPEVKRVVLRGGFFSGWAASVTDCLTFNAKPIAGKLIPLVPFAGDWDMDGILYTSPPRFRIMVGCCFASERFENSQGQNL